MSIDDYDVIAYDDEVTEIPGGRDAARRELAELFDQFIQNGGSVQQIPHGATGWASGFMSQAVADRVNARNARVSAQAARFEEELTLHIAELLETGLTYSVNTIAANRRTTKDRIRKVLRERFGDHPLARAWLADGRTNGNTHRVQHGESAARILDLLRGMAERGEVESLSVIARNTGSTCRRVRALIGEHFADDPIAQKWLADGRKTKREHKA